MKLVLITGLVFLAASSKVRELNDTNFEHDTQASTGSTTGDFFVLFYAPWCGHCKKIKPEIETLAEEIRSKDMIS